MPKINKKIAIAAAAVAVVAIGGGTAFAYWTTTGSGSGTGSTAAGQTGNVSFTNQTTLAAMYPGDSAQNFKVTLTNNSTQKAYVTGVKVYVTTDKGALCDGTNFKVNGLATAVDAASAVSLGWTGQDLAASGGTADTSNADTIQFNNKATAQDDCESAVVTLHYLSN